MAPSEQKKETKEVGKEGKENNLKSRFRNTEHTLADVFSLLPSQARAHWPQAICKACSCVGPLSFLGPLKIIIQTLQADKCRLIEKKNLKWPKFNCLSAGFSALVWCKTNTTIYIRFSAIKHFAAKTVT